MPLPPLHQLSRRALATDGTKRGAAAPDSLPPDAKRVALEAKIARWLEKGNLNPNSTRFTSIP